jgi:hypothetical protein
VVLAANFPEEVDFDKGSFSIDCGHENLPPKAPDGQQYALRSSNQERQTNKAGVILLLQMICFNQETWWKCEYFDKRSPLEC